MQMRRQNGKLCIAFLLSASKHKIQFKFPHGKCLLLTVENPTFRVKSRIWMEKSFVLEKSICFGAVKRRFIMRNSMTAYQIIEIFNLTLTLSIASESRKSIKGGHQNIKRLFFSIQAWRKELRFFRVFFFHYALKLIFSHFSYALRGKDVERAWSHKRK